MSTPPNFSSAEPKLSLPIPTANLSGIGSRKRSTIDLSKWSVIDDNNVGEHYCRQEAFAVADVSDLANYPIQKYSYVSSFPAAWQYYLHQMYQLLATFQISEDQFHQFLTKTSTKSADEIPMNFELTLDELIYRDLISLKTGPPITAQSIYQMWLYFRKFNPIALQQCPDLDGLEEQITYNTDNIMQYAGVYRGYFKSIFEALLLANYKRKQLFLVIIDGDNRDHLLINYQPQPKFDSYQIETDGPGYDINPVIFEIDSEVGIELRDVCGQDRVLYVLFSGE